MSSELRGNGETGKRRRIWGMGRRSAVPGFALAPGCVHTVHSYLILFVTCHNFLCLLRKTVIGGEETNIGFLDESVMAARLFLRHMSFSELVALEVLKHLGSRLHDATPTVSRANLIGFDFFCSRSDTNFCAHDR